MKTKVQRWGNSLAVQYSQGLCRGGRAHDESPVDLRLAEGGLLLEPSSTWAPTLDELLDGVTESNLHDEVDTGSPQGSEAW